MGEYEPLAKNKPRHNGIIVIKKEKERETMDN